MSDADLATLLSAENGAYVEGLFEDHVLGRGPVPAHWVELFDRLLGRSPASNGEPRRADGAAAAEAPPVSAAPILGTVPSAVGIVGLINAYRTHGHLIANLDPLGRDLDSHPFLDPGEYGIGPERMDVPANCGHFLGAGEATPRQLIELLRETYCGSFAVEFMEMREKERRDWLIERMEPIRNRPQLSREERVRSLMVLLAAEQFEQFLHKRFLGQKRFSIEGGDALIPLFDFLIEDAERLGGRELVIAMAHRGRLNVLVHTMGVPYRAMLAQFRVGLQPRDAQGAGDVKYHRGFSCDRRLRSGHSIHLSLCANPSHLEAINPVAEGMVRAKQNYFGDTDRSRVMTVLVHGDAAFTGQGMVAETLSLSELDSYTTGGTIHLIVNNQIGFTTDPRDYRFTRHPSDLAKIVQAPVFHVNADDPEACVHAARLAIEFRQQFHEDVIIDLVCYRRHGHNEGDDPSFTQPTLYKQIATHPTVGTLYTQRLLDEGILDAGQVESIRSEQLGALERAFEESAEEIRLEGAESYRGLWEGFSLPETESEWGADTRVPREVLLRVAECFTSFPEDFEPHPKIKRLMTQRREAIESGAGIDWGAAEALAFGTLLLEGHIIRLTGQDVERGTFSHRHAVLHDYRSSAPFIPLNTLRDDGDARLFIRNSLLSEAAVLGFEYGYSTVDPKRLAIWEAQFGDFANSAQVIIDQFISSAETKWGRASGLVMLLPHRALERASRALPAALRRGQSAGVQPVDGGAVLPRAAAPAPPPVPQAADRDGAEATAAPPRGGGQARRPGGRDLPDGARRSASGERGARPGARATRAPLLRQGLLHAGGDARGARLRRRRDPAPGAAAPVPVRGARRAARPLRNGRRRLGPGGALEPGCLVLRAGADPPRPQAGRRAPLRRPQRGCQHRHRLLPRPHRAGERARAGVLRPRPPAPAELVLPGIGRRVFPA
jgi:2-oxoglutarate dehydrogenase E1 component